MIEVGVNMPEDSRLLAPQIVNGHPTCLPMIGDGCK